MATVLGFKNIKTDAWKAYLFLNKIAGSSIESAGKPAEIKKSIPSASKGGNKFKQKGKSWFTITELSIITTGTNSYKKYTSQQLRVNGSFLEAANLILGRQWDSKAGNGNGDWVSAPGNKTATSLQVWGTPNGSKTVEGPFDFKASTSPFEKQASGFAGEVATPAAGGSPKPSTVQQEEITLRIFEALLGENNYKPTTSQSVKSQKKLREDFNKLCLGTLYTNMDPLYKIWGALKNCDDLDKMSALQKQWYFAFLLQFGQIEKETGLPNGQFKEFKYDGPGSFMDFISNRVTSGPPGSTDKKWPLFKKISKKDSWNPADIWLVRPGTKYNELLEKINAATSINQINKILREAFKGSGSPKKPNWPLVVGISLKKTGDKLEYDLINLSVKPSKKMAHVNFGVFDIRAPFKEKASGALEVGDITSHLYVKNNRGAQVGDMILSGGGKENLTLEFTAGGEAKLGKVPKNLVDGLLENPRYGLSGDQKSMPDGNWAKKMWPANSTDGTAQAWKTILRKLISYDGGTMENNKLFQWGLKGDDFKKDIGKDRAGKDVGNVFINNLITASKWPENSEKRKVLVMMQNLQFAYTIAKAYDYLKNKKIPGEPDRTEFDNFIEQFYYYAQKKGSIAAGARFGPFGKLH